MPIIEKDPWRQQYFEHIFCPDEVIIPTDDVIAYQLYPNHRWVYNKLNICETQGLECGPHGLMPSQYPVFSKPIYNMRGMGVGSRIFHSLGEMELALTAGHMWMPLLTGEHISSDVAVINGQPVWWRHTIGIPLSGGAFDYWIILSEARPHLEAYCGDWICRNLNSYTGMLNFETINGIIIECHLRLSDQWVDLYGKGWMESVVELYTNGKWNFSDNWRKDGYSVVLFAGHGSKYHKLPRDPIKFLLGHPEISSIQITFHESKPPGAHAMPPGGFRLAIVNCWNLMIGFECRQKLALLFGLT